MAVTISNVVHSNTNVWEGTLLGRKARVVNVTFDSSYDAGGEVVTAGTFGWDQLDDAIVLRHPSTSDGSSGFVLEPRVAADRKTLTLRVFRMGATLSGALAQAAAAQNLAGAVARVLVIGA